MKKIKLPSSSKLISDKWLVELNKFRRYSVIYFLVFIAVLYGIVFLHINNLNNAEPSDQAISLQVKAAHLPKFDSDTLNKIYFLRDNSVSVQSLFNQERNNPFESPPTP